MQVYAYVGNDGTSDLYIRGEVEKISLTEWRVCQDEKLMGYEESLREIPGEVLIKGYPYPFNPGDVFEALPDNGVLTPLERWIRVNRVTKVTSMLLGIKITRTAHLMGNLLALDEVVLWEAEEHGLRVTGDHTWEEVARKFARQLATQRPQMQG